ncbi:MAG: outer membrane protein assembly factor BamE [Oscillospiraceae bacterium]|jgi:hypothetical protein|nr:outer membrane protein assembly factor BamE [Oscillospiraceae bacterium]
MKRFATIGLCVICALIVFAGCALNQMPPALDTYMAAGGGSGGVGGSVVRATPPPDAKPEQVTADEYQQIEIGMTYEEVVAIVGGEGRSSKRGKFTFYAWSGFAPMSNDVTMSFDADGKLVNKDPQSKNISGNLPGQTAEPGTGSATEDAPAEELPSEEAAAE